MNKLEWTRISGELILMFLNDKKEEMQILVRLLRNGHSREESLVQSQSRACFRMSAGQSGITPESRLTRSRVSEAKQVACFSPTERFGVVSALVAKCSALIGQICLFTCKKSEKLNLS